MARGDNPSAMKGIDTFPRDRAREYLRDLLSPAACSTRRRARSDTLEWIDGFLAEHSSPDRHALLAYAHWHTSFPGPDASRQRSSPRAPGEIFAPICVPGPVLDRLHTQHTTLDHAAKHISTSTSHPIRMLRATGPSSSIRTYATNRSGPVTSPTYHSQRPTPQTADAEHWQTVERLLHDESIRVDTRLCGLFILLYGQRPSHISRLTRPREPHPRAGLDSLRRRSDRAAAGSQYVAAAALASGGQRR